MLFNSYEFVFAFFPISIMGYYLINKIQRPILSKLWLLAVSLFFYGSYSIPFFMSLAVNFASSRLLSSEQYESREKLRKSILILGLVFNIGLLCSFKYYDSFINSLNSLFNMSIEGLDLILPLGISFFTFQQIAFLVDSYRDPKLRYNIIDYALFVSYFPKIVQGPIALHKELIPQFNDEAKRKFNSDNFAKGLYSFSIGLSKKLIIADQVAKIATYGFGNVNRLSSLESVLTILAYAFQLYFDFSGYCDMANGVSLMFNIELPINFNSPYKATNISDFWKRWHMTLTRFLTTYVYFPLGGSRCSKWRTYINVIIVFLISGIWHGTGYNFMLWGLMHGLAMVIYRAGKNLFSRVPNVIMWTLNFIFINITWVYFRAATVSDANILLRSVFNGGFYINAELSETLYNNIPISIVSNLTNGFIPLGYIVIAFFALLLFLCLYCKNVKEKLTVFIPKASNLIFISIILIYSILSLSGVSTFLYSNF